MRDSGTRYCGYSPFTKLLIFMSLVLPDTISQSLLLRRTEKRVVLCQRQAVLRLALCPQAVAYCDLGLDQVRGADHESADDTRREAPRDRDEYDRPEARVVVWHAGLREERLAVRNRVDRAGRG